MTTFADAVTEVSSQKHLLFEVEPAEALWNWALSDGQTNTYEVAWSHLAATDVVKGGIYRQLISIEEDGTALTETDSIANVEANAGYYYHDEAAGKIYVHTSGSADPDTLDMTTAIFRLHFSTTGKTFVKDAGAEGRNFDGTNDYYTRGSALDGVAESKKCILSAWLRIDDDTGTQYLINTTGSLISCYKAVDGHIVVALYDSTPESVIIVFSNSTYTASPGWHHLYFSCDASILAVNLYIDGVDDKGTVTALKNATIDFIQSQWRIGVSIFGGSGVRGPVSGFYFYPGEYLNAEGRLKFRDINGEPVGLGDNGELPTGTSPAIYAPDGDASNNLGTGGNFTETGNPTLASGPTIKTRHINYEKRVLSDSTANVSEEAVDLVAGRQRTTRGEISLDNSDKLFDKLSRAWNWKNKQARYRFGIDDIPFAEYQTTGRLVVDDIAPREDSFTLSLVAGTEAWRHRFPITPHFGAGLGEGVIGTRVPILIGSKSDIIPDLVDDEATNPNEWVYRIADNTYQTLDAVSAVYAINRSTGARTTLTLTTHYTVSLATCSITVLDAFDAGAEIEEKYEIRCDAVGQPAASGDTSTDYLQLPGEVVHWILNTFLGRSDSVLDLDSFSTADTAAPFDLAFWIKRETTIREVLRGIERSVLGTIRPKESGIVGLYIWDPWSGDADAIALSDEDFSHFEADVKMGTVYYKTSVLYDENPAKKGSFEVETVTHDATRYLNSSENYLKIETYLKNSSDAQLIAQRINFLYRGINVEIDFAERGIRMMDHELYQRVKVTKTRASSTAGTLTSRLMELLEIEKDFVTPRVTGRLGDLRGLVDVIGKWTEATAPTWSAATDEEKAASGFWTDANGLADASDLESAGVSRWW